MFDVTTGPFRVLEEAFFADFKTEKKNPLDSVLVLSPSGKLLTHLQGKLAAQAPGFLNTHFLTFYALAERLLSEAAYTETVVTEPALYQEMIRHILTGKKPEAVDLAIRQALKSEGKPIPRGLAGALAATMKDLRDAGMRADKALQATQEGFLGAEAPEAAATLALYARLIGLFEKHHLRSSADLLRRAALAAPKNTWLKSQKAIFLYGFYDLTGVQLDLVLSLASRTNARVYFPYEAGNPAYAYAEKLLKDPAFVSKVVNVAPVSRRPGPIAAIDGSRPTTCRDDERRAVVSAWSCSGARDEIWITAKEIVKLADEGISYQDIAVVSRNVAAYLPALREIFTAHEIPYMASRNEPAGSHPLVKTVQTLLTFDPKHPRAKTLTEDLEKSPYTSGATAVGTPFSTSDVPAKTAFGKNDVPAITPLDTNDVLAGTALWSERRTGRNAVSSSWSSHITYATELIHHSIHLPKHANAEEIALLAEILDTLQALKVLDRLGEPVTWSYFLDAWQEKMDALERPGPTRAHAGVQVLEVQQARGLSFKALFIVGMNEKIFPRLIREDPFLSDAARAALAQATGCRLGRKLDGYNEERFLFELMRETPSQHLYLMSQRSDEEGKARIPSVYLKELERQIPGFEAQRLPRSSIEKFDKRSPLTWTPKELSLLINRAKLDPKALYKALHWDLAPYVRILGAHAQIETFRTGLGPYDGVLTDPSLVQPTLAKGFSPSALEDLAQCPFQYYAGHMLRIPIEEDLAPEGEMTPQALGQLFHKTLELFYIGCREQGLPQDPKALQTQLEAAAEGCFEQFASSLSTIYPLALKAVKLSLIKELLVFLKADIEECMASGFLPHAFEQPLSGTLPTSGLNYPFHGKPDRLDLKTGVGTTETRVVDYKSGKPKTWSGKIETHLIRGRFLQLPIYLGLAKATSATLRPVRETDEEATEKTLTSDFWGSPAASIFTENIKELIGIIEKERFYIEPSTGEWGYCTHCDFAMICRKEHMPTRLRAERDPLRIRMNEKLDRVAPTSPHPNPLPTGEGAAKRRVRRS